MVQSELETFASCGRWMRPLFISDEATLKAFAEVHLASEAQDVGTASDDREARRKLAAGGYNVVVIDLDLPRASGFGLLEALKADGRAAEIPVVVCARMEDAASVERAFDAGVAGFITKPVNWRLACYQIRLAWRTHQLGRVRADARTDAVIRKVMNESAGLLAEAMTGPETLRAQARRYAGTLAGLADLGRRNWAGTAPAGPLLYL